MERLLFLIFSVLLPFVLSAQHTYVIDADSVKLTNGDSAELIIENHSQAVPGFLYNTGNGRTVFRHALSKVSNGLYLVGSDSLRAPYNAWVQGGNAFGSTGILGTSDNNPLDLYTNNTQRARLDSSGNLLIGAATAGPYKMNVAGPARDFGYMVVTNGNGSTKISLNPTTGFYTNVIMSALEFGNVTALLGILRQDLGNIPANSFVIGWASPQKYTALVDYYNNPVFVADGGGISRINGGYFGIGKGGAVPSNPDYPAQDLNINGPRGTGTGRTGDIIFSTGSVPGSGAIIHIMTGRWWVKGGTGYLGNSTNPTSAIDATGAAGYSQLRLHTTYTPTSSTDANGNTGNMAWDGNNLYIKTSSGWKRSALSSF